MKHEIERQLLPRLKVLGGLLILFGIGSFLYGLIATSDVQTKNKYVLSDEMETSGFSEPKVPAGELEVPPLKQEIIYLATVSFWVVGTACILFAWRQNARLKQR